MEKVAQLTKVMRMEESVGFNFCDYFALMNEEEVLNLINYGIVSSSFHYFF